MRAGPLSFVLTLLCKPCCAVLCREEAQELQKAKPKLDAMGVKLVGRAPLPPRTADFLRSVLTARGTPLPKPQPAGSGDTVHPDS